MNTAPSSTPEGQVKAALLASKSPEGKRLAEETKIVKYLASQLVATASLAGKFSSPAGIGAIFAQKILFTGGFIAQSDLAKCSVAVGLLTAQTVGAVAAGVPTGGVGTVLMAAGMLSQVYNTYDSCKAFY